jgi:hypothetical protein
MIRVPKPISLADKGWLDLAEKEREAACAFFKKPANRDNAFKVGKASAFKAYGDKRLRESLNKLYSYKCAYCEVDYGANQPVAVEHYRPKARVSQDGKITKPGYYWLAAEWTNLFPSCTDCNSRREQSIADQAGSKIVIGKGDEFPLVPGSTRATKPGDEEKEQPLLLNPAVDEPVRFIRFEMIGAPGGGAAAGGTSADPYVLAVPRGGRRRKPYPCAETSIRVYALNRVGLANRRGAHATRLLGQLRHVKDALAAFGAKPNEPAVQAKVRTEIQELRRAYFQPNHELLAMSREIALRECPDLNGRI